LPGNDRPGVMLAGAVRAYLNRFAVAPEGEVVIARLPVDREGWRALAELPRTTACAWPPW